MNVDWGEAVPSAAGVVAAVAAAAAAFASWRSIVTTNRHREEDTRERARDSVLSILIDLQRVTNFRPTFEPKRYRSLAEIPKPGNEKEADTEALCSRLQVVIGILDPEDLKALPSAMHLTRPVNVGPTLIEEAINEMTILRRNRPKK